MDLETLLGDAYKDGMTLEEINTALADKNFVDPSTLPKSVSKALFDKTASELVAAKKKLKELEGSTMSAEEKAKELQKQYATKLSELKAKEIFVAAGLTEKDYASLLDVVISEDEETTSARTKAMIDVINAQKQAVEKAVKAELLKDTPKPRAGQGGGTGSIDYDKEIKAAQERNDMVAVASLIRQKQLAEKQKE